MKVGASVAPVARCKLEPRGCADEPVRSAFNNDPSIDARPARKCVRRRVRARRPQET